MGNVKQINIILKEIKGEKIQGNTQIKYLRRCRNNYWISKLLWPEKNGHSDMG